VWDLIHKDTRFVKLIFNNVTFTNAQVQDLTMKETKVGRVFNNREHKLLYAVIQNCEKQCCKGKCTAQAFGDSLIRSCFTQCKKNAQIPALKGFLTGTKIEQKRQYTVNDLTAFKKQLEEIRRQKEASRLENMARRKSIAETRRAIAAKLAQVAAKKKEEEQFRLANDQKNAEYEAKIKALEDKLGKNKLTATAAEEQRTKELRGEMKSVESETSKLEEEQKSLKLDTDTYKDLTEQQLKLGSEIENLQAKLSAQEAEKKRLADEKKALQAREAAAKAELAAKLKRQESAEEARVEAKRAQLAAAKKAKIAAQTAEEQAAQKKLDAAKEKKVTAAKAKIQAQIAKERAQQVLAKKALEKIKDIQEVDTYYSGQDDVGTYGGTYTCPNGTPYYVGDNNDNCKSLAGTGGTAGECFKKAGIWSNKKVKCNIDAAENQAAMAVQQKKVEILNAKLAAKQDKLDKVEASVSQDTEAIKKQNKIRVEAKYAQKLAMEKQKLKENYAGKLDANEKKSVEVEGQYKKALAAQASALEKTKKVEEKMKYVGEIVKLKKQVETAIKNDDIKTTKSLQGKINDLSGKLLSVEKANKDKMAAIAKAKAELAKLKAGGNPPSITQRILAEGFTKAQDSKIKLLGTELYQYQKKLKETQRLELLQTNLSRRRLASSYAKDYLSDVYIKEIKIKSTRMYNIQVSNLEVLIPVVKEKRVEQIFSGSDKVTQEKVDMPDWDKKVWPYSIILPTKKQDGSLSDNLYRWPKYEFDGMSMVYARNRGKYLKFVGGQQKVELQKSPKVKQSMDKMLDGKATFLVYCQNGNKRVDGKTQVMTGEPVMEYDCPETE